MRTRLRACVDCACDSVTVCACILYADHLDYARYEHDWLGTVIGTICATDAERPRCLKLGFLHALEFGEELIGAHGALADARGSLRLQHAWSPLAGYHVQEVVTRARARLQWRLVSRASVAASVACQTLICPPDCRCRTCQYQR
eukprot:COSAG02_NODE_34189_length_488_cov_0.879177_1_plen_144_part_00